MPYVRADSGHNELACEAGSHRTEKRSLGELIAFPARQWVKRRDVACESWWIERISWIKIDLLRASTCVTLCSLPRADRSSIEEVRARLERISEKKRSNTSIPFISLNLNTHQRPPGGPYIARARRMISDGPAHGY
jgi:hypothetical protein